MLTIGLTTPSSPRLATVYRTLGTRKVWRGLLLGMFVLVGLSLALHFILHTHGDLPINGQSHQYPPTHTHCNVVHSNFRAYHIAVDRVAPNAACSTVIPTQNAAIRYFDETPVRTLVSTALAPILSARGPPARP